MAETMKIEFRKGENEVHVFFCNNVIEKYIKRNKGKLEEEVSKSLWKNKMNPD